MKTFKILASDIDDDLFQQIKQYETQKTTLVKAMIEASMKTEVFMAIKALQGRSISYGTRGGKLPIRPRWTGNGVSFDIDMDELPTSPPKPSNTFIEPRVLNNLLNGKLLSDAEKRAVLKATLPEGIINDETPVGASTKENNQ